MESEGHYVKESVDAALEELKTAKTNVDRTTSIISGLVSELSSVKGMEYVGMGSLGTSLSSLEEAAEEINSVQERINLIVNEIVAYSNSTGEQSNIFWSALLHPEQHPDIITSEEFQTFKANIEETFKNVTIEEYKGEYILVPKNYQMSLQEYEDWAYQYNMHQNREWKGHNFGRWQCRACAELIGCVFLSDDLENKIAGAKGWNSKPSYCFGIPLDPGPNQPNSMLKAVEDSNSPEPVIARTMEELLKGYPCVLQVNQQEDGKRHEVTAVGLKASEVFNAIDQTGKIDYAKLYENYQDAIIVVEPAYHPGDKNHPDEKGRQIGSLNQFGKTAYKSDGVYQMLYVDTTSPEWNRRTESTSCFNEQPVYTMDNLILEAIIDNQTTPEIVTQKVAQTENINQI